MKPVHVGMVGTGILTLLIYLPLDELPHFQDINLNFLFVVVLIVVAGGAMGLQKIAASDNKRNDDHNRRGLNL